MVKQPRAILIVELSIFCLLAFVPHAAQARSQAASNLWITGYYPGWQDDLKPADIDYASLTDLIYFTLFPTEHGRLDTAGNGVNDVTAKALAAAAHKAGVKVLICIGGDGAGRAYRQAIKAPVRATLVQSIVDWVKSHGYDGVDIDFEPMKAEDGPDFQAFIVDLRAALNRLTPSGGGRMLLTTAVECEGFPATFGAVEGDFDQINMMTYDMAGDWSDESWYNSPLMNAKSVKGMDGDILPATDQFVTKWLAKVSPSKLGIGVCCEGRVWHGVDALDQPRRGGRVETLSYAQIMDRYYRADRYHWDDGAKASSLIVTSQSAGGKALVVYDDVRDIQAKVAYARKNGLGGIILWELSEEYRPSMPPGRRHPLLTAVHEAARAR